MDLEQSADTFHSHSPWRKIILIPIWAFETTVLAVNVVTMGLLIGVTNAGSANNDGGLQPWTIINLVVAGLCLVMTLVQVVVFINRDLSPRVFLWATALKGVFGLLPIAFEIYVTRTKWIHGRYDMGYLYVGFGFGVAVCLAYVAEVGYGVHVWKKVRMYRMRSIRFSSPEMTGPLIGVAR